MQEHNPSSFVTRIVIALGILSIVGIVGFFVVQEKLKYTPVVLWETEGFAFKSGKQCIVFIQPKLALIFGKEDDEIFDCIGGYASMGNTVVNDYSTSSGFYGVGIETVLSRRTERGKMTIELLDGKSSMVVSRRGTKLTLADGREFTLDGQTPLWLRCKSDGTIVELDELPQGFVEFFESQPPESDLIGSVKSWPDVFRK